MKKLALLLLLPALAWAEYYPPQPKGIAYTMEFLLYNTDGTLDVNEVDGGAEVSIHCDQAASSTATNDFADIGNSYSIALTAVEMECDVVTVVVAATDTNVIIMPTLPFHGTAQSGTASTIVLDASESFGDDQLNGERVCIVAATGAGQCRVISDTVLSSDTLTVEPDWDVNPAVGSGYRIEGGSINVAMWSGDAASVELGLETSTDIWATATRTLTAATNITSTGGTTVPQTGDSFARLGAPAGASVSADIVVVEGQTDDIGVAGAGLTDLGGMSTGMMAEVEAEATDALEADGLNYLVSEAVTGANVTDDSIIAFVVGDDSTADWDTYNNLTDSLEAQRNLTGVISIQTQQLVDSRVLASGTCDTGSTTTCADAELTQADDYWNGSGMVMTSGAADGQTSCVYDFTASTDTLLFRAMTAAVSTDTYILVEAALCEGVVAP